eukprot:INCI5903.4.p1 GENE.INCI5903.4~~INCI5903.4.p1  ORF type:complete len:876 (-),score=160.85 INCI5903.4:45-2672(-)
MSSAAPRDQGRSRVPGIGMTDPSSTADPLILQGQELIMLRRVKEKFEKQLQSAERERDRERITAMREALVKLHEQEAKVRSPRNNVTDELAKLNIGEVGEDLQRFQQHEIIQEALSHEVDLRAYSQKIESELRVEEGESLPMYVAGAPGFSELDAAIEKCSRTLRTMEDVFCTFQGKLSGLSDEIQHLQDCSVDLSIRLQNRRRAEVLLDQFLTRTLVPVDTIRCIVDGACGAPRFVECLQSLHKKIIYVQSQEDDLDDTLAIPPVEAVASRDVILCLQKLRRKAVHRIREYIMDKLNDIPTTSCANIHVLKRSVLQKVSYFVKFLRHHAPDYAVQTQSRYIEVLGGYFLNFFRTYQHALMQATAVLPSAHYLLGADPTGAAVQTHSLSQVSPATHRGVGSDTGGGNDSNNTSAASAMSGADSSPIQRRSLPLRSGARSPSMVPAAYNSFEVGDRIHIVSKAHALDPPLHEEHVAFAAKEHRVLPYEVVFRSLQKHLLDHAVQELDFLGAYFGDAAKVQVFKAVFDPVFADRVDQLEGVLLNFYDSVGVMIMIRVVHIHREEAHRHGLGMFMDDLYETQLDLLWSRLGVLNDRHYESLTNFELPHSGSHAALASTQQHFISRRYGELLASLFKIVETFPSASERRSAEGDSTSSARGPQEISSGAETDNDGTIEEVEGRVQKLVAILHEAVLGLLTNMAQVFESNADKHSFLINNYDQIWTILVVEREVSYSGMAQYQDLAQSHIGFYVEEELRKYFPRLIEFVKACEDTGGRRGVGGGTHAPARSGTGAAVPDAETASALLLQFEREWQEVVKRVDSDIIVGFSNFRTGSDILKKTLTQLLLYYTRFVEIVNQRFAVSHWILFARRLRPNGAAS